MTTLFSIMLWCWWYEHSANSVSAASYCCTSKQPRLSPGEGGTQQPRCPHMLFLLLYMYDFDVTRTEKYTSSNYFGGRGGGG